MDEPRARVTEVVIYRADASSADKLREIRLLSLRDEPDAYGSTLKEAQQFSPGQWELMATSWNYFLAVVEGSVVGMAGGGRNEKMPNARWLYGMFVRSDVRGSGVADRLVGEVAQWARGEAVDTLGLHVTTSLPRARAFYSRLGFSDVGRPEPMDRSRTLLLQMMTTNLTTNDRI
jgi:GNAT superfamily N-acetyltransferase